MKDTFDRKLAGKFREELSAYREPFQPDDWVRMQGRMAMHKRSAGFLVARACAFMLFATSVAAYFLYDHPFSLFSPKPYGLLISVEKLPQKMGMNPVKEISSAAFSQSLPENLNKLELPGFGSNGHHHNKLETISEDGTPPTTSGIESLSGRQNSPAFTAAVVPLSTDLIEKRQDQWQKAKAGTSALALSEITAPSMDLRFRMNYAPVSVRKPSFIGLENFSIAVQQQRHVDEEYNITGANWGFGIYSGFRFGNKFSLTSGLNFSRMSSHLMEIHETKKKKEGEGSFQTIHGYFDMIDIPVHLSWKLSGNHRKNRHTLGVGFSNFLALKERYYRFSYETNFSTRFSSNSSSETYYGDLTEFHFMNTLNISWGLEKRISTHSTITFEPFVQLPLSTIGEKEMEFRNAGLKIRMSFWSVRQIF